MARTRSTTDRRRISTRAKRAAIRNIRNANKTSIANASSVEEVCREHPVNSLSELDFQVRAGHVEVPTSSVLSHAQEYANTLIEERCPQPAMRPAIIRVFEDRMVRVTILRREGCVSSTGSAVTARLLALSAVLASAAAFSPISMCHSSNHRFQHNIFLPSALANPLHKGFTATLYGGMGMKTFSEDQILPLVTAAAAVAAVENVIIIKTVFSSHK
jgi:hypothetical protein